MVTRASPGSDEGGDEGGHEAAAHEAPVVARVDHHRVTGRERQGPAQPKCEGHRLKKTEFRFERISVCSNLVDPLNSTRDKVVEKDKDHECFPVFDFPLAVTCCLSFTCLLLIIIIESWHLNNVGLE